MTFEGVPERVVSQLIADLKLGKISKIDIHEIRLRLLHQPEVRDFTRKAPVLEIVPKLESLEKNTVMLLVMKTTGQVCSSASEEALGKFHEEDKAKSKA